MPIVSEQYTKLVGVDTHARTHALAVVQSATGAVVAQASFPTTPAGLARAAAWAGRRVGREQALYVVEGAGSYGAALTRLLAGHGLPVVEPSAMPKGQHRGKGKSDPLDAARIARSVAGVDLAELREPREDGGIRTALQILATARDSMTAERTRCVNALTALLRLFDLGIDARKPLTGNQIQTVSRWRTRNEDSLATATGRAEAVRLAARVLALRVQEKDNEEQLRLLAAASAPGLMDAPGIGPVTAAAVLVAWSHPGRIRSEAALASLAGVNPIPASSGNTTRHRLNRGGDRRLNRAVHTITLTRMRCDADTRAYVDKRTAQGKTKKEITRILKRYITRQLYRQLEPRHAEHTT